jgi:hypothetical protein
LAQAEYESGFPARAAEELSHQSGNALDASNLESLLGFILTKPINALRQQ